MSNSTIILVVIFTVFLFFILGFLVPFFDKIKSLPYIPKNFFVIKNILFIFIFFVAIFGYYWIFFGEDVFFKDATFDISTSTRLDF